MLRLAAAAPGTAAAWTGTSANHERRGLKHRPDGAIRMVPAPPVLVAMLRAHHAAYRTASDGLLFRGTRGGPLSESVYGRAWHAARALALGADLAASGLALLPHDLRHAALSLWLNAGGDPAQIAARAGNSVAVLLTVCNITYLMNEKEHGKVMSRGSRCGTRRWLRVRALSVSR